MSKFRVCFVVFVLLCAGTVLPAQAGKKRAVELEPGFFNWDQFSYSEQPQIVKTLLAGRYLVKLGGGIIDYSDEVITYDGDSTLTTEFTLRAILGEDSIPERLYVAAVDPTLGEALEVDRISIQRKAHPEVRFKREDLLEEVPEWSEGYYDSRRLYYIPMPEDSDSATVEISVRVITRSQPGFEGLVQTVSFLQTGGACRERVLTIRYPKEHPLYLKQHGFTAKIKPKRDGDWEEVTLALKQLMPLYDERWSAHMVANFPSFLISSVPSWDDFHERAVRVYEQKIVADDAIRAEVARLTEGLTDDRAKAEALYRFITMEFHYLGVYFGEAGWVPHPAPEVFSNRYGDCKDHTILLVTMLREAGIEAYPALINAGEMGLVDQEFPFFLGNHAIVYAVLDGQGMFLDGVSNPYLFGTPRNAIRNRQAVVLKLEGHEFVDTPGGEAQMWSTREETQLTISHDGALVGRTVLTYEGSEAAELRDDFRTRRPAHIERDDHQRVARHYMLAEDVVFSQEADPAAGGGPLERTVELRSDEHVRTCGPLMFLELPFLDPPSAIEAETDAHDFPVWVTPFSYQAVLTVELPLGYQIIDPPEDHKTIRPGGVLKVDYTTRPGSLVVEVDAVWKSARLAAAAAESYAMFRTLLADNLDQQIVLQEVGR